MEDAYAATGERAETSNAPVDEDRWRETLARFGDVKSVADQLREVYKAKHLIPRFTAFACAISILVLMNEGRLLAPIAAFIDVTPLVLCLAPFIVALAFDFSRGSCHWDRASYAGTWGSILGAVGGVVFVWIHTDRFNEIGMCLAVSLLSALYGLLFFAPTSKVSIGFIGIVVINIALLFFAFGNATPHVPFRSLVHNMFSQPWTEELDNALLASLAFSVAGVLAGLARFGFKELRQHSLCIGTGAFYICVFQLLTRFTGVETFVPSLLVAFAFLPLAMLACVVITESSHLFRRSLVK
jgi:hypothetical protein